MTGTLKIDQILNKSRYSISVMEEISQFEPNNIESDDIEFRFEDDGLDSGSVVSIVDECGKVAIILNELTKLLEKSNERIAELESDKESERRDWMARGVEEFSEYIGSGNRTVKNIYCEIQASVFASDIRSGEIDL